MFGELFMIKNTSKKKFSVSKIKFVKGLIDEIKKEYPLKPLDEHYTVGTPYDGPTYIDNSTWTTDASNTPYGWRTVTTDNTVWDYHQDPYTKIKYPTNITQPFNRTWSDIAEPFDLLEDIHKRAVLFEENMNSVDIERICEFQKAQMAVLLGSYYTIFSKEDIDVSKKRPFFFINIVVGAPFYAKSSGPFLMKNQGRNIYNGDSLRFDFENGYLFLPDMRLELLEGFQKKIDNTLKELELFNTQENHYGRVILP